MHEKQESYLISEKTQHEVIDQEHVLKLEQSGVVQCGIATCRESFNVYRKSPKQHMLLFTIRGKGWLNSQGQRYLLEPGSVMIIPAGVENGFGIEEENWQLAWLFLSAQREWPNHLGEQIHYGLTPAADVMYTCIQTLLRTPRFCPKTSDSLLHKGQLNKLNCYWRHRVNGRCPVPKFASIECLSACRNSCTKSGL